MDSRSWLRRTVTWSKEHVTLDSIAEFPWGIFAFLVILVVGAIALLANWKQLTMGEYLGGISAGAGLLGIGHGIRTGARHFNDGGRQYQRIATALRNEPPDEAT